VQSGSEQAANVRTVSDRPQDWPEGGRRTSPSLSAHKVIVPALAAVAAAATAKAVNGASARRRFVFAMKIFS